jgi:predicted transcriptional regulator
VRSFLHNSNLAAVAAYAGVTRESVYKMRTGERPISVSVAEYFGFEAIRVFRRRKA